ncbi:MAG: hypothetical protein RLZZ15_967 [Verrucomicrobiota bacterium]|jgi:hypothetical protein
MRIAFVTGNLEPGRDGVGDYTRTLAEECARRGHTVALLSLAESARPENPESPATAAGAALPTLRLTPAEWRADGGAAARRWLDAFAPDWASLQFVPFSYDPRGFFGGSIAPLARILGGARRRHVFFHELWIGSFAGAPAKARAFGWWQRRTVAALLRAVAPERVATSTGYYRAALATIGRAAAVWPVFGAVPRGATADPAANFPGVAAEALVCGHFGTLHPNWECDEFLKSFAAFAAARGRPAAFVAAGALGYGAERFAALAASYRGRIDFVSLGRLDATELARAFARFDFAATSVPWNILGKSSSAAALREHGLRVVATAAGSPPRFAAPALADPEAEDGCVPFFRDRALSPALLEKTPPRPGVSRTAEHFLRDLHAAY